MTTEETTRERAARAPWLMVRISWAVFFAAIVATVLVVLTLLGFNDNTRLALVFRDLGFIGEPSATTTASELAPSPAPIAQQQPAPAVKYVYIHDSAPATDAVPAASQIDQNAVPTVEPSAPLVPISPTAATQPAQGDSTTSTTLKGALHVGLDGISVNGAFQHDEQAHQSVTTADQQARLNAAGEQAAAEAAAAQLAAQRAIAAARTPDVSYNGVTTFFQGKSPLRKKQFFSALECVESVFYWGPRSTPRRCRSCSSENQRLRIITRLRPPCPVRRRVAHLTRQPLPCGGDGAGPRNSSALGTHSAPAS